MNSVEADMGSQAGRPSASKFFLKDGIITSRIDRCRGSLNVLMSIPSLSISRARIPIDGLNSKEMIPESSRRPLNSAIGTIPLPHQYTWPMENFASPKDRSLSVGESAEETSFG